ncbi:hypothetical protein HDU79_004900 [Rhizoclosmatium sp. JEL0117]|nr:hypothetical protein HDU79_004900 [Rhizoclosmatium sp. JEL0117]
MTDQSHVVQALKDAVNSVDALRGTVSESREQWRNIILPNSETHSAAFRSRSVDHFNQPFKLNSHSASRSPELRGGSPERGYLGSQPVFTGSAGSAFVRPEPQFRTTSPQQQQFPHHQQQSSYSIQNYPPATIITPQPIPQQPVTQQTHQSQHQFEQRMHEIVSSAVNEAIARETPTSIKHPDPKPKSFKDMEAERIINESLSSSSNTNQNQEPFTESPSISPIPHSTSQHKHNYSSSFESSKTSPSHTKHRSSSIPRVKQVPTITKPRHASPKKQAPPSTHSKSASSSTRPVTQSISQQTLISEQAHLIKTLSEKLDRLTSRIDELEARETVETTLTKFEVEKLVKSRVKSIEARLDGVDAKVLQMEMREVVKRVDGTSANTGREVHDHDQQHPVLMGLLKNTIPNLQAQVDSISKQVSQFRSSVEESIEELESKANSLGAADRRAHVQIDELVEAVKVLQGRFDFQLVSMENMRKNNGLGSKKEDILEDVDQKLQAVVKTVKGKVDTSVLEELMKHLATRDEVKRVYDKVGDVSKKQGREFEKRREEDAERIKRDVFEELRKVVDVRLSNFKMEVAGHNPATSHQQTTRPNPNLNSVNMSQLQEILDGVEQRWLQHLEKATSLETRLPANLLTDLKQDLLDHIRITLDSHIFTHTNGQTALGTGPTQLQTLISTLTREFDAKLYLLCTDLSACKSAYQAAVRQPFYRCAQWLWTSSTLKLGSTVPWDLQTTNTDPVNFKWEAGATCVRVQEAGLYEITFAFFDVRWRPSVQVVVNGESVLSALNAPGYVVHHGSGFVKSGEGGVRPGTVTGCSLMDFLSLPAKSTVALHYHAGKKELCGHGFLGLRRL